MPNINGKFLLILIAGCMFLSWGKENPKPPNVILIITDDQGYGDLTFHGNKVIETPHLDKLASSGVSFNRFFVSPVCAPTRASVLTGKYALSTGVSGVTGGREVMRSEEITLAELLKNSGYKTGCFGKWHNGSHYPNHPLGQGFDIFVGFTAGHWNNYFDTNLEFNGQQKKTNGYIADVITNEAIAFIEKNNDSPFFSYIAYNTPHSPFQVPDNYFNKFKARGLSDELSAIYGMCENIDDNVGRILKRLDELDLTDKTVIVFLGDNGPNSERYNDNMKGIKASVDEGGMRVPFFISWKNEISPEQIIEKIAAHIDILPTIAELVGVDPSDKLDGISLNPLLNSAAVNWPSRNIYQYWSGKGAVRTDTYRLTINQQNEIALYNMNEDPSQSFDIAEANPFLTTKLLNDYNEWYERITVKGFSPEAIPLGYSEYPAAEIEAIEAIKSGSLKYYEGHGWANDWITNWVNTSDSLIWYTDIVETGEYEFSIKYSCPENQTGSKISLSVNDTLLNARITEAFEPSFVYSPDRVKRKEVYEKQWAKKVIGTTRLKKGKTEIIFKVSEIGDKYALDLKSVVVLKK